MNLIVAWAASALAFGLAFVGWVVITGVFEDAPPPLKGYMPTFLVAFGAGLLVQFIYGGFLYVFLRWCGIYYLWIVVLAYLAPVVFYSYYTSDTYQDLIGSIPWLVFALVLAVVSWTFASRTTSNVPPL